MPSIDVAAVRAATAATATMAHFNNAGASLPSDATLAATIGHLRREAEIGGYRAADERNDDLRRPYAEAARMIGADPSEIAMQSGASEAWWRAFTAVPIGVGTRIVAGRSEFITGAAGLAWARERGAEVILLPDNDIGEVDLEAAATLIDGSVDLVCLTWIPTSGGLVQPAAEIGRLAEAAGAIYLLDACQAAGQRVIDVDELRCDFLTFTGRKYVRGPRGTGALYVRASRLDELAAPVFVDGASIDWDDPMHITPKPGAARFEFGERSKAAVVGFGVALAEANELGLDQIQQRVTGLADRIRAGLRDIDGTEVHDRGRDRSGIVTFSVDGHPAPAVAARLRERDVTVSVCPDRQAIWDLRARGLGDVVRASVHYYNDDRDLERLLDGVGSLR